jgi:hypothetical protein
MVIKFIKMNISISKLMTHSFLTDLLFSSKITLQFSIKICLITLIKYMYLCLHINGIAFVNQSKYFVVTLLIKHSSSFRFFPSNYNSSSAQTQCIWSASSQPSTGTTGNKKLSYEFKACVHKIADYDFLLGIMHFLDPHADKENSYNEVYHGSLLRDEDTS